MDKKFIFSIQKKIFNKVHPDITFLIDLNKKESKVRINKRAKKTNKFDKLSSYHFNKIRNGFRKISKMYKNKIVLIKGSKSLIEIQNEITSKTLKILNARL
jgi:dTMP kinase